MTYPARKYPSDAALRLRVIRYGFGVRRKSRDDRNAPKADSKSEYRHLKRLLPSLGGWMRNHIRRREFICFLGGAAAAPLLLWPLNGRAQQRNRVRLIGVSMNADEPTTQARIARLARSLQELGWIDGRN